jgi:hypothetical protein
MRQLWSIGLQEAFVLGCDGYHQSFWGALQRNFYVTFSSIKWVHIPMGETWEKLFGKYIIL